MADFIADLRDLKFVLFDQMNVDSLLASEKFSDFSRQDLEMITDEAYKLARDVLGPANEPGDREGCTLKDGQVYAPKCYHEPFKQLGQGGWCSLSASPEFGGQGAPELLRRVVDDLFYGAAVSINLGALLTTGSARLIETFGTQALRGRYCEKMYSGTWAGTMCLTESNAGSDVGASKTKALRKDDHYLIEGEKIFISFGDHDLTENIIHCVLARVEGAPAGTKGLSLFVVPKYLVGADGAIGGPNNVVCANIEHKLGIHGSPTCTMNFGANGPTKGWLLGEENRGMAAMFQMMNGARIEVGAQGSALASAAYQQALAYARERLQGAHISKFRDPGAPRVPIIEHPDVRVMLMRQKAYSEGCRSLLYYWAFAADMLECSAEQEERDYYHALVEFTTPIAKAYCTDMGFRVTEWALQCFGGYGYLKDYPVEQHLRDSKILSIYEGTNGIQALDLVGRKMPAGGGANLKAFTRLIKTQLKAQAEHPLLKREVEQLSEAREAWSKVTKTMAAAGMGGDVIMPLLSATTYLSLCGDLLVGHLLLEQAVVAHRKLESASDEEEKIYLDGKIKTAQFFIWNELPNVHAKAASILNVDKSAMEMRWPEAN